MRNSFPQLCVAKEIPLTLTMSKYDKHCAFTRIVVNESELSGIAQPLINKDREVNLDSKHLSFEEEQKTDDHPSRAATNDYFYFD